MQIIKSSTVTWIDLPNPTFRDIHKLINDFGINHEAANQLKDPTLRPMVENYDNFFYIVLHFPIFNEEKKTSESAEIDFIITPTSLFTTRYTEIEPFENLLKKCSSLSLKNSEPCLGKGPVFLFYYIVKELFDFSLRELDHIQKKISAVEEEIFKNQEKEAVPKISQIRRDIINFSSTLQPQKTVLENLLQQDSLIDNFTRPYIEDLLGNYHKVINLVETKKETIEALYDTNESLLNAKTNEIMKILTIMAFVTFPLMLISSIFGMNTHVLPITGTSNDFWVIIGIMAVATLGFFVFFKKRKWL